MRSPRERGWVGVERDETLRTGTGGLTGKANFISYIYVAIILAKMYCMPYQVLGTPRCTRTNESLTSGSGHCSLGDSRGRKALQPSAVFATTYVLHCVISAVVIHKVQWCPHSGLDRKRDQSSL